MSHASVIIKNKESHSCMISCLLLQVVGNSDFVATNTTNTKFTVSPSVPTNVVRRVSVSAYTRVGRGASQDLSNVSTVTPREFCLKGTLACANYNVIHNNIVVTCFVCRADFLGPRKSSIRV